MAIIYLATNLDTCEESAVKVLLPHIASNKVFTEKFLMEVKANLLLRHPNIVEIRDGGVTNGQYFMVLEYIDGTTLQQLLKKVKKVPIDIAFLILLNIMKGLEYAHKRSIIHRDMKPSNIMITRRGEVKIADFGISKVADPSLSTATTSVMGTPAYMSPEQARGQVLDARSDIFSAGIMFYEMLRGKNPFQTGQHTSTMKNIINLQLPTIFTSNPTAPPEIDAIIKKMLYKDPAIRYQNAGHALSDLQGLSSKIGLDYSEELFGKYLKQPEEMSRFFDRKRSLRSYKKACDCYEKGGEYLDAAFWHCYVAVQLDSSNTEARKLFDVILKKGGYSIDKSTSEHFREKERQFKKDKSDMKVLTQLLKIARIEGYTLQLIYYFNLLRGFEELDRDTLFAIHKFVRRPLIEIFDTEKKILSFEFHQETKTKPVQTVEIDDSFRISDLVRIIPSGLLWILLWAAIVVGIILICYLTFKF